MNLRPFFCFYGGKWRAAPQYPAPIYPTIVEPFAGAAGYSTRYPDRRVILLEKDPTIAALWRYLIRVPASEIRSLPTIAHDQTVDDLNVCPEAKSLIGFWLNAGTTAPCRSPSSWMRSCIRSGKQGNFWGSAIRERIASQVEHIRHWRIVEGSYSEIQNPILPATWYVDPPYQKQGRYYRCSANAIDFSHLGDWCKSLRGQVMVCEQDGAAWLPFRQFLTIQANPSKHGKGTCREVLWQNGIQIPDSPGANR